MRRDADRLQACLCRHLVSPGARGVEHLRGAERTFKRLDHPLSCHPPHGGDAGTSDDLRTVRLGTAGIALQQCVHVDVHRIGLEDAAIDAVRAKRRKERQRVPGTETLGPGADARDQAVDLVEPLRADQRARRSTYILRGVSSCLREPEPRLRMSRKSRLRLRQVAHW